MVPKERRKHFLINKPLQFRYMAYISGTLMIVSCTIIFSLYFGIWGGILDAFSNEKIREDLLIATRLTEYEDARFPQAKESPSVLSFFKQSERLSVRQREVFKDILDANNKKILAKLLFLCVLIAWGSIYLSHKIAGPLYRIHWGLEQLHQGLLDTRITLRQGDEAQFMATQFNDAAENIDMTVARIKNIIANNETNPERLAARLKEELAKIKTSAAQ